MVIESESKTILKIIVSIILTPYKIGRILLGKDNLSVLFDPFRIIIDYITQAKVTFSISVLLIVSFIVSLFLPERTISLLVSYPDDLLSLRAYTLVTTTLLHANTTHLLGNLLALNIFGRVVERKLGGKKTAAIYFFALIISSALSSSINILIGNNIPGIGASGAIMGLVSAAMLIDPFYITYEAIIPLPVMIIGYLTIIADINGLINPANDNIGRIAHIGGFISIIIMMWFFKIEDKKKFKKGLVINITAVLLFGALLLFYY